MPVPDPPFLTPRIMKVLEPSAGQYEVVVRMDPTMASKFPDKPFGTAIDQIGLAAKDSAKYEGYTLVAIEPADRGAKDHLWIFQKLPGPLLSGNQAYVERTTAVLTVQDVAPGTATETGLLIVQSSVKPDGAGKSVKEVVSVPSWPVHTGSEWDPSLGIQVGYTEQFVAPPVAFNEANTSFKPVNGDRVMKVVKSVPTNINSIHHIIPTQETVDLPATLISASVIVSRVLSNNNSVAGGQSFNVSNGSQVAVSADIDYELEDGYSGPVDAEIHVFYMPVGTTTEAILARTTSLKMPRFKPKENRVIISGRGMTKGVTMSGTVGGTSLSETSEVQSFVTAVSFPASLHVALPLAIIYVDHTSPTGLADAYVDRMAARQAAWLARVRAAVAAGERVFNLDSSDEANTAAIESYLMSMSDQINLNTDLSLADFTVSLSTPTLPATTITSVPTGRYLKNSRITDYDYGYVQVVATVVII